MRPSGLAAAALLCALAALPARAQELTPGPGAGLTTAKCTICHDAGHIARSKLSRNEWTDNLANMITRGMPPLSEAESRAIIDYLSAYYGAGAAPPPAADTVAGAGDDPVQQMLNAHACNGCHSVDQKVVGPAFREVAQRYAGNAGAAALLAAKIRNGGSGAWGSVPMPGNSALADQDLARLVEWVLGRK